MKSNKIMFIIFVAMLLLAISAVSASDVNETDDNYLTGGNDIIKVDDSSTDTIKEALEKAGENDTIYLAGGVYKGSDNSKLIINKSVSIIGSDNTVIDGLNKNYIFTVADNVTVTFKNIKFVNAYKSPESYGPTYDNSVYGSVLDIKNAKVIIEGCTFENNVLAYGSIDKYIYGGAVSSLGDLTIINSVFRNNTALSTSGLFSYGGALYNKGKANIKNSSFLDSKSVDFGYGAAIANNGELTMENSIISGSTALHECRGSAVYNAGKFVLTDSIIENNYIERANFNYIYGAVYNSGEFKATGNIFRNNTGYYETPMSAYKGSPTIYSVGVIDLNYNAFIDNNYFEGISRDVYINGGDITSLDNNWWNTNENPYEDGSRVNIDEVSTWIMFKVTPQYSKLNISEAVTIKAYLTNNIDNLPQIEMFPVFNVTFQSVAGKKEMTLINGEAYYTFDYTQNKGLYDVDASLNGFKQVSSVDVGKVNTAVKFNISENITYKDNLTVDVEVVSENANIPTGAVLLKIDDDVYTVNLSDGKGSFIISNLVPKDYTLDIVYDGDEDNFKAFNTTAVHIKKQTVDLSVTVPEIKVGQKGTLIATLLPQGVQGQAVLYIDGVRKKIVYLYNGNTSISLSNFAEGEYNITLEFVETPYYYSTVASGILNVTRYDTQINITSHDIHVGENATITISVSPETLRGEATLIINGVSFEIFIDDTVTNITLENLNAGEYDVTLIFEGDLRYYPVNVSTSFKVLKTPSKLDVNITQDEKNLTGIITVKVDPKNCSGAVGIYINYQFYTLNLTDGEAVFNVKFDKGTNYIFVFYEGDEYYEESTWNTTIGVDDEYVFIGENSTGYAYNDFNYSVRLIEVTGIPMPNRIVSIRFNGEEYNVTTDDNGYAFLKLNLASGEYDISATYKNTTIYNKLKVNDILFNLTVDNITYGDIATVKAIFDEKITGKVKFVIENSLEVICDIVNGSAVYDISGLDAGSYVLKATYFNDFTDATESCEFNVAKDNVELNVDIASATPNTDEIITVTGLKNATGNIIFTVNGNNYESEIKNGQSVLNLSKLAGGKYSLVVKYGGDKNYLAANLSAVFYVKEFSSQILVKINDAAYASDLIATATLNEDATGIVRFSAGDLTEEVNIVNAKAVWNFTGLNVGKYNITAEYLGNDYYVSSKNSTLFEVKKANSTIDLYVKEVALGQNIRIYADLSTNATGSVSFSMIGYFSPRNKPVSNSQSSWYIAPMENGEYTVIARYLGDDNYYASNTTFILKVHQKKSILNVEIDDAKNTERVSCKITLKCRDGTPITAKVTLKINDNEYVVNVREGKGSLVIGKMAVGNYNYTAQYDGDENYTSAVATGSFKIVDGLLNATLTAYNLTKYYGGSNKLLAILKDSNGNPFADQELIAKIGSKEYKTFTDANGRAQFDISIASGTYGAVITYAENDRYHSASANATLTVLPTVVGVDVVKLYGSSTQYFAMYTDSNGKALANKKVTFTMAGKSYSIKTLANGVARININIKAGTYTITSKNPSTGETLKNKITIYYKIMGNKDTSNYYGAKSTYKVRIYGTNAKPLGAGKTVTFKLNGKTYKIKTNKNGYATLSVKLPAIKKYTVTATYGGFKVSNKITVKNVLSASNISKKKTKTTKFKAKLVNSAGKVLKGKKITFKINGKTYTAKTNAKGIATATIKIALKVGKHKITCIYGKAKLTRTITVKK